MNHMVKMLIVLALGALAACAQPLVEAADSPTEAARQVVDAIGRNDRGRLEQLAVSEAEFREQVWPELPAARPERNLTADYVWTDLHQKSQASLGDTLRKHAGRGYAFVDVTFQGPVSRYAGYEVHREAVVRLRRPDGTETEERLFGSMIQKDDRWKVFSYVVD